MKSLSKAHVSSALQTWSPPDLDNELFPVDVDAHKEQVLTVFQKATANTAPKRSSLHLREAGTNFTSWLPDVIEDQVEPAKPQEWYFIELPELTFEALPPHQLPREEVQERPKPEKVIADSEVQRSLEQARKQAEDILLAAQAEAEDLLLKAGAEIEARKQEGYRQGQVEAHTEMENTLKTAQALVQGIADFQSEFLAQSEQILVEMVKDMARRMFSDGVRLDPQTLHTNLTRIMENAHGLGDLKIFLNPEDARALDPSWREQQMLIIGEQVKIVPSSNITRGGCLVKGNLGTVDGRVETQLDAVLNTFDEQSNTEN
ncbi:MAG TPA: FliH/SctL family protein [Anaerolineales bacterium]|nr:FliH/SctL family protein [Anaerolineales bacterium]HNO30753.1 FliH/SctL family protein [Anaerolineales bacterium]